MTGTLRLLLLILALLPIPVAARAAAPTQEDPALAKVEPAVREAIKEKSYAEFWVVFKQQADLSAAARILDWNKRGAYVVKQLQATAAQSQSKLRQALAKRNVRAQSFWIANALFVPRGDDTALLDAARRSDVVSIVAEKHRPLPPVQLSDQQQPATLDAIEWNISKIKAPQVWSSYGTRGEGIVVANIDSGVQFNHPALVRQYRGRLANGSFNHNYNWFDPSKNCGNPSVAPCDNNGHGTHTMGTMIGDDGAGNQIGVAPGARWIAAKGCEESSCSDESLLAAGQWMLAPTDLSGRNPRPDLRPHIINNSWGDSDGSNTFYNATIDAWIAAGMFPVFSNGNSGPMCQTAGSPADDPQSYAVGAFDQYDSIADFSSRGSSRLNGGTKPNISAPGVGIRSAYPDNDFSSLDGTSMAAPHVAGAIALLWSASSQLLGDIPATRALLDQTATNVSDTSCGGTASNNNVWGQGKLDIYEAVSRAKRDIKGSIAGTISNQAGGAGILGATITAVGPAPQKDNFMTTAGANGAYSLRVPAGAYTVTVSAYGYNTQTINGVAVSSNASTTRNAALVAVPSYAISGVVRSSTGAPLGGVTISTNAPIPAVTTDQNGNYTLRVPQGAYVLQAQPSSRCNAPRSQNITVNAATTANFSLSQTMDLFGYGCQVASFSFVPGTSKLALSGDEGVKDVTLPFAFRFYGKSYSKAYVSTNGFLSFAATETSAWNGSLPDEWAPHAAIYPFWDDLVVDASSGVYTAVTGTAPNRQFVIEWRNVSFWNDTSKRVTFETLLHENGSLAMQYKDIAKEALDQGGEATIGVENADSTIAFQYSSNEAILTSNFALSFRPLVTNMVQNPGFELDNDYDGAPDSWTRNNSFWREYSEFRGGTWSGRLGSEANASFSVAQTVGGILAGQKYSFAGAVDIPPTSDSFSFSLQVQWRSASDAIISTQTVQRYTAATNGWDDATASGLTAPAGAAKAKLLINVSSLNGDIYVDHFIFGK